MHRIYLKNMGVKATVAISLVVEGKLWGLLVFHHNDPRLPPNHMVYELRIGCDFVSDILSMYLSPTLNNETIRTVEKHQRKIEKVVRLLAANPFSETTYPKLLQNIQAHLPYDFIGFCNAEHCFICESGQFKCLGPETITSIKSLFSNVRSNYLARHDLIESQEQITHLENMAGIAVMRSPILTDLVAFFGRVEIEKTVSWGGKPKTVTIKTINNQRILEPRSSFARWRQNLKGQCDFWEDIDFKVLSFCFEQIKDFIAAKRDEQHLLQLQKNTHYDLLTGLPNRALLANFIEALRSKVEDAYITLFFIDLDNFKQINDFRGHEVGDLLLIKIAERLRMCVRPDDLVVRLGGDEFVIVLVNAASPTTREIASISKKIIEVISSPVIFGEFTSVATASVGIVNSEVHLVELNEALKQADIAMYCAKNNGKNQFSIFKQKQQDAFNRRVVLFDSLRQAIDKNKLRTYFQPQFNASKKLVGVEALARWDHETFGPISPEVFIEVAEQNSLIYQLGLQLFQSACQSLKLWQECQLIKSFQTMSINISPSQLSNPNFINDVLSITNTLQINPRCIRLEITESVFMKYFDVCMDSMSALREKGFSASLDDFGTGYSSLNYLWRLPIDEVKIDQSFVKHMLDNESLITMVSSMIDMCHRLNLTVVAEGVEKDEEYQLLSKLGCDIYQGYFFSKPVSDAECLEALLFIES